MTIYRASSVRVLIVVDERELVLSNDVDHPPFASLFTERPTLDLTLEGRSAPPLIEPGQPAAPRGAQWKREQHRFGRRRS